MNVLPLIAQNGLHHKVFEGEGDHNAMWDMNISPEGKPYFSLGSELVNSNYARLYEYDLENDEFVHLFNVEDVILHSNRTIRPSKIHTSINFLPNGHILCTTHTTDRAPDHPYWLPEAYYAHPHEGYQGSNIIEYDPVTKKAFSHGIPIPYETIYGGVYIERTNTFYFLGFFKGNLYSYNLETREIKDFGQATELGVFRLHEGPDGKLYFAGRSGYLMRFNIETEEIEELHCRFIIKDNCIARLDYALNLDDSKILLFPVTNDYIYLFDTQTDTLENLGNWGINLLPENENVSQANIFGPALDSKKVLWYTVNTFLPVDNHFATLYRWDFLNGKKPEILGTIGSTETGRICSSVSEAYIRDDVYYIADTNHADDLPGFVIIDLKEFEPHMYENAGYSTDPYVKTEGEKYQKFDEYNLGMNKFKAENPYFVTVKSYNIHKLWTEIGRNHSKVKSVNLTENGACGYCGKDGTEYFFRTNGEAMTFKPINEVTAEDLKDIKIRTGEYIGDRIEKLCISGRQYKAIVSASAKLRDGFIIGTADGVLGTIKDGKVFRLGRVGLSGPVRDLVATPDGKTVYGVSGDEDELGILFKYTEESGVEELGTLHLKYGSEGFANSTLPCCCDVSDDGKTVVVGVNDAMGCVYILHF